MTPGGVLVSVWRPTLPGRPAFEYRPEGATLLRLRGKRIGISTAEHQQEQWESPWRLSGENCRIQRSAKGIPNHAMSSPRRLNLAEIEASLRAVQANFDQINRTLSTPRDTLSDQVLGQLLLGYEAVDRMLAESREPFQIGDSACLLRLNHLVLCGEGAEQRPDCRAQVGATAERFYDQGDGGIEALSLRVRDLSSESVWRRAAGVYIQILSQPQLFIEGNHRTGALIMSWLLANEGRPPFVLSVGNAKAYFDPSALVKNARKRTLKMLLERPKLVRRFADLLKAEVDKGHRR